MTALHETPPDYARERVRRFEVYGIDKGCEMEPGQATDVNQVRTVRIKAPLLYAALRILLYGCVDLQKTHYLIRMTSTAKIELAVRGLLP
ncbi:hypothetical protein [Desulfonatronum sp. SC1]|uniref:hypothetical protein n=1 Tax=Desulfonatronum sp. SC1 TaxID=2109626 RepID=UPI001E2CA207|nr:hypothetical protein [Desulfonatronum sp. SC1]